MRERISAIEAHQKGNDLPAKISKFVEESKKNLNEMNQKITEEHSNQNTLLHDMTVNYEAVLKKQIQLLNQNKAASEAKDQQEKQFNSGVEKLTLEYEAQIKTFEKNVKANVKRIQDLSNGGNMIARLLKNDRFRQVMQDRGCSLEALENQCKLEEISEEVEEREREIQEVEEKGAHLDEELSKMHELIETMKNLLENMMKEKENLAKQNAVLKEKLKQSEELIGKLLGGDMREGDEEDEEDAEEDEGQ